MDAFGFSERQAQHILEMQLRRLTGLEREKIEAEMAELQKTIAWLEEVLGDRNLLIGIIKEDLQRVREKYGDERRTSLQADAKELDIEDLIAEEDMVITITNSGYIKRLAPNNYRSQKRGGKGVTGMSTKTEDYLESLFIASTHDYLMVFTEKGRVFRLKVHEIPESSRTSKGTAIINYALSQSKVKTIFPVKKF